jgi:protein-disulfide isomerase
MSKLLSVVSFVFLSFLIGNAHSQPAQFGPTTNLTAAEILKQLESSGALEKAVQKTLESMMQKQKAAQAASEQKNLELQKAKAKNARKVDPNFDFILGNLNAPISIIEYSDYECPYCKQFNNTPIKVVSDMPNQVNLVWRDFPLSFHEPMASKEAGAAICAAEQGGNTAFWKYSDAIMKNTRSNGLGMPAKEGEDAIIALASSQGLDIAKFKACLTSPKVAERIAASFQDGVGAGINGTPGVIIVNNLNGKTSFMAGAVSESAIKEEVQKLLSTK